MSILLDMQKLTFPDLLVFSCVSLLPVLPKLISSFSCKSKHSSKWNSRMRSQACRNEKHAMSYYLCRLWSQSVVQCHKELQKHKGYLCISQMQNRATFTHLSFLFLHSFTLLQTCSLALTTNKNHTHPSPPWQYSLNSLSWTVNKIKDLKKKTMR